jgi:hypothetical protein
MVWVGELFESVEASYYSGFRNAIVNTKGIPDSIKAILPLAAGKGHQGGILSAAGFAGSIGGNAASALFAPYGKLLNYEIDKTANSSRLDPQAAVAGLWRAPESEALLNSDMNDLGWTGERLTVLAKIMRPRIDPGAMMQLVLRDKITPAAFVTEMGKRGYLPEDITGMQELSKVIPGVQDLINIAVREGFDDATASRFGYDAEFPAPLAEWAKKQGLDVDWSKRYWRAHWQLPSPSMGFEMMHRLRPGTTQNPFTKDDLGVLLKAADYPQYYRNRMMEVSYSPYTRVDVRRMYKLGVITQDQLVGSYLDLGYDDTHAKALADFTIKYETSTGTSIKDDYEDISLSLVQQGYSKGVFTESEFRAALDKMGYKDKVQDLIVSVTNLKTVVSNTPDYKADFQADLKNMVTKAYAARIVTSGEANSLLTSAGVASADAEFIIKLADFDYNFSVRSDQIKNIGERYTSHIIDRSGCVTELGKLNVTGSEQAQVMSEWDSVRLNRTKRLSEAQYRAAYQAGYIMDTDYRDALEGLGYSDYDIDLLLQLYPVKEG